MHRGYMYNGSESILWTCFIPFVLLVLIAIAGYMIFKNNKGNNQLSKGEKSQSTKKALEILDERYAAGAIDNEEYEKKKKNLNKS